MINTCNRPGSVDDSPSEIRQLPQGLVIARMTFLRRHIGSSHVSSLSHPYHMTMVQGGHIRDTVTRWDRRDNSTVRWHVGHGEGAYIIDTLENNL